MFRDLRYIFLKNDRSIKPKYLIAIVCPRAELHLAVLIVEWKPGNIDFASAFKNPWRHI